VDEPLSPWSQPDFLPEKPDATSYGYVFRETLTPCDRETLIERCRGEQGSTSLLVWAPETARVVPAVELPFLQEAIRERLRESTRRSMRLAGFCLFVYSVPFLGVRDWRSVEYQFFLLLSFAILPLVEGWWELRALRAQDPASLSAHSASARYAAWLQRQPREISWFLTAIIVVVFVLQLVHGMKDSIALTGLTKGPMPARETYRFLTGPLMHGSIPHVAMNAIALFFLGTIVEALLGSASMAFIFVASALGGSVLSYLFVSQPSVGASGGIMGLLGCLAVLGLHFRKILPPNFGRRMLYAVFLTAMTGLAARHIIDNAAHAGGLIVGAALGWEMVRGRTTLPLVASGLLVWAGRFALVLIAVAFVVLTKFLWPG
jgi:membrane associated rhomboid family serine protease